MRHKQYKYKSYVQNDWDNDGTGANFTDLRDHVFSTFGYSCGVSSYSSSTVLAAMQQLQLPVVMCAYDNVFYILGIPIFWRSTGHAFLIDRYKTMRIKTTYVYEWVYDVLPPGGMVPIVDPRIEVVYGSPYVSNYIGMNWGWGGSYDNIWYAADGNWNAGGYDFCYERKMMTGFYYNNLP